MKSCRRSLQNSKTTQTQYLNFHYKENCIYKNRLVISHTSFLIPELLSTFHDSVIGGHSSYLRTYKRMTGELYWKGMKKDVRKYADSCLICQKNKVDAITPIGLLQPLPVPDKI